MKKWEYKSIGYTPGEIATFADDYINRLGQEGWEMCGTVCSDEFNKQIIYFKREIVGE